ncbi:hypothetical protein Tcan_09100 [Toxocara canis]|uniref:Uncharacterized protein n=1 Tax=Toxocara canis TaxID=6265 RepID=A0A0B2VRQ7_TOXCA|nr:hypothetical protein Tcan_09100 [Toxocara canis]
MCFSGVGRMELERQSISKADRTKCASLLRHCLLAADPQFLGRLGEVITKLAIGEVIVGLDTVIQTLLNFADDADSCSASAEKTERQSISKADRTKCASLLRHCLLAADPQFLGRLGEVITKLAIGEVIVGLDTVIQTLLNFADDADSCSASAEKTEWRDGEREQECGERSAKSASPEAMQSVKRTLVRKASISDIENGREQSLQDQRIEQAKRRLSTSKAKLQKQRTLERVRCLTGDESGEEKNEKELKGNCLLKIFIIGFGY